MINYLLSPVHTGNKVEFNMVDFVEPATMLNVVERSTFNFVAGLFGNNLNIYESRDDPVTSRNKSINFKGKCIYITQFM